LACALVGRVRCLLRVGAPNFQQFEHVSFFHHGFTQSLNLKGVNFHFRVDSCFPNVQFLATAEQHSCVLIETCRSEFVSMTNFRFLSTKIFNRLNFFKSISIPHTYSAILSHCDNLLLGGVNENTNYVHSRMRISSIYYA